MNIPTIHGQITKEFDLLRESVDPVFDKYCQSAAQGRGINITPFMRRLRQHTKGYRVFPRLQYVNESLSDVSANVREFWYPSLSGICYEPDAPEDDATVKPAKIDVIFYLTAKNKRVTLSEHGVRHLQYRFYNVVLHELIHRVQYAMGRRVTSPLVFRPHTKAKLTASERNLQMYLGEIDEIEAYARDCVEEWFFWHPHEPLTFRQLRKEFAAGGQRLSVLQFYHAVFYGDDDHPAIRRLFRKVLAWNDITTPLVAHSPFSQMCAQTSPRLGAPGYVPV